MVLSPEEKIANRKEAQRKQYLKKKNGGISPETPIEMPIEPPSPPMISEDTFREKQKEAQKKENILPIVKSTPKKKSPIDKKIVTDTKDDVRTNDQEHKSKVDNFLDFANKLRGDGNRFEPVFDNSYKFQPLTKIQFDSLSPEQAKRYQKDAKLIRQSAFYIATIAGTTAAFAPGTIFVDVPVAAIAISLSAFAGLVEAGLARYTDIYNRFDYDD